jgi:hypothetical protein
VRLFGYSTIPDKVMAKKEKFGMKELNPSKGKP